MRGGVFYSFKEFIWATALREEIPMSHFVRLWLKCVYIYIAIFHRGVSFKYIYVVSICVYWYMEKRESIGVRVFSSNFHKLERTIKATDIWVRKGWPQPPPSALLFQGSRRKSKEMQFSLFHFSEEEAAQKSPCVCQQDSELGTGLLEKEIENKIK